MLTKLATIGGLSALVVGFFAVNMIASTSLTGSRIDLTEGSLYTLAKGSRNIASNLNEPITLTLYYSAKLAAGNPGIQSYGQRCRELLEEYARLSKGKIKLRVIDPEPFSDDEDAAMQNGLAGVPISAKGETVYLGLVGVNSVDGKETIPFLDPQKERFLEYDVTRLIYALDHPKKKVVGLMTNLPIDGNQMDFRSMRQQQGQAWKIKTEVESLFEVKKVETSVTQIPEGIDVLWVVHPKNLSDATLYAIDQYVLGGGHLVAFVDPQCDSDMIPGIDPMQQMQIPKNSDLNKLLNPWGVEVVAGKVATDDQLALKVQAGGQRNEPVSHIAILGADKSKGVLASEDAITGQLSTLILGTPGIIRGYTPAAGAPKKEGEAASPAPASGPSLTIAPLVTTTERSAETAVAEVGMYSDPRTLLAKFQPSGKKLTIAARLTGKVKTAFPNGKPEPPKPAEGQPAPTPNNTPQIMESKDSVNAVLVADCDMLADRFWVNEERLGPISLGYRKFSDNGDFVTNAIDNMIGNADLISVRARGQSNRPFDLVDKMEKQAEGAVQAKVQGLQEKLRTAEQKIAEIERQKPGDQSKGLLLSPEQQAEIEKFREERLATRKELRAEQLNLRKDIETLGTKLKFINIAVMPVLVALAAVGLGAYRVSRRGSYRKTVASAE